MGANITTCGLGVRQTVTLTRMFLDTVTQDANCHGSNQTKGIIPISILGALSSFFCSF